MIERFAVWVNGIEVFCTNDIGRANSNFYEQYHALKDMPAWTRRDCKIELYDRDVCTDYLEIGEDE